MAYSTVAQFRQWVHKGAVDASPYTTAQISDQIEDADNIVRTDLSKKINFDLVPEVDDDPPCPNFINLLSRYKTNEMTLVAAFGAKRTIEDVTDIQYWQKKYNDLLEKALNGEIDLVLDDGTSIAGSTASFENTARPNIRPAFGEGEFGEFVSVDQLQQERPIED